MCEQVRMSMKIHAYFREKVLWEYFEGKFASEPVSVALKPLFFGFLQVAVPESEYISKEVSKFLYFMFAPTLVYRDHYPRNSRIRWSFVLTRLAEAFGIIYYAFLIFRQILPVFASDFGPDKQSYKLDSRTLIRYTFSCM
jgi:sterol O-acyltransferase